MKAVSGQVADGFYERRGYFMPPKAVYLHIPFCSHKCHYCDFTAFVVDGQPVDDYLVALEREMELTVAKVPPAEITSIFIGGGTPTILTPKQMEQLLHSINIYFPNQSPHIEFTIEANPGTTSLELLTTMRQGGVNRISFGAQTFRPDLLSKIGRIHSVKEINQSVNLARQVGFDNLSLDLMFGLPTQTIQDMEEALEQAIALEPDHLSCYGLKVEEGTLFHHLYKRNELPLPTEEDEFNMYQLTRSFLRHHGYDQYEISNFARSNKESSHNKTYWLNEEYYGLGTGAHGYMNGFRHANIKGVREYIERLNQQQLPIMESYQVGRIEDVENFMILGLRLMKGISRSTFFSRYQQSVDEVYGEGLKRLQEQKFILEKEDCIALTEKGILFGNDVFSSFLQG